MTSASGCSLYIVSLFSLQSQPGNSLGIVDRPDTRPRTDVQHTSGVLDGRTGQLAAQQHAVDVVALLESISVVVAVAFRGQTHQIHAVLLLLVVGLEDVRTSRRKVCHRRLPACILPHGTSGICGRSARVG